MHVKLKDIEFSSPLLTASGTYGYGHEVRDMVDVNQWGGIITKSVTRHPREGNPPPRFAKPIEFSIPDLVSAIRGGGFPSRGWRVTDLVIMPPHWFTSTISLTSWP